MAATNYFKAIPGGPTSPSHVFPFDEGDFAAEGRAFEAAANAGRLVVAWKKSKLYPEVPVVGECYEKRPRLFLSLAGASPTPFPKAH